MKVRDALRHLKDGFEVQHDRGMDRFYLKGTLATSAIRISRNLFEGLEEGGHLRHAYTDGAVITYGWSGVDV